MEGPPMARMTVFVLLLAVAALVALVMWFLLRRRSGDTGIIAPEKSPVEGPGEVDLLRVISRETATRPLRVQRLQVHEYASTSDNAGEHLALPGTISVLLARRGSPLLGEIREALASGSGRDRELAARVYGQYAGRRAVPLARAVEVALAQPVLADLCYGGTTLVPNLFVPEDLDVALVTLPYTGGRLAAGGFSLVEHPRTENDAPLEVLVLRYVPPLSIVEKVALDRVPEEQDTIHVGHGPGEVACSVLLLTAAVVVEVAIVAATFAITGKVNLAHVAELNPQMVEQLGPAGTARALLEARRGALMGQR